MQNTELLMGINALSEVLRVNKNKIVKVFVENRAHSKRKAEFIRELEKHKVSIKYIDKKGLERKVLSDSHQSFVAEVKRKYLSLQDCLQKNSDFLLLLDGITDPHNFGAILRASECFKVDGVIYSKNKGCPVTPVVTKVSSGASELIDLVRVSNLHDTILKLKKSGYTIVASDCSVESVDMYSFERPEKMVFILGSEGKGVSQLLKRNADYLVHIPMKGQIDSLNVSQAAACFLSYFASR